MRVRESFMLIRIENEEKAIIRYEIDSRTEKEVLRIIKKYRKNELSNYVTRCEFHTKFDNTYLKDTIEKMKKRIEQDSFYFHDMLDELCKVSEISSECRIEKINELENGDVEINMTPTVYFNDGKANIGELLCGDIFPDVKYKLIFPKKKFIFPRKNSSTLWRIKVEMSQF